MQYLQVLLLAAIAAAAMALPHQLSKRQSFSGFPFGSHDDDDSMSDVFPKGFPFHNVGGDDDSSFFNPFFSIHGGDDDDDSRPVNPFSNFGTFFEILEDQLRTMKEEIDDLNRRIDSSNTTVVDGHVVTVNETTHRSNDTDNPFFYHVKVINIRPSDGPDTDEVVPYIPSEQTPEPYEPTRGDETPISRNDEENEIPQVSDDGLEPL